MESDKAIKIGEQILTPLMKSLGLGIKEIGTNKAGSGGPSSFLIYSGHSQRLECHYRFNSMLVIYGSIYGDINHSDLVWALSNDCHACFPTYTEIPETQFNALSEDIKKITNKFYTSNNNELLSIFKKIKNKPKGLSAI